MIIRLAAFVAIALAGVGLMTPDLSMAEDASIEQLLDNLASDSASKKYTAANALAENPTEPGRAIPLLVQALEDERVGKHLDSVLAVPSPLVADGAEGALPSYGAKAVPAVTELLEHSKSKVRSRAASILTQIGDPAASSASALATALLKEKDTAARIVCLRAYGKLERDSMKLTQVLLEVLNDDAPDVYALAIRISGRRKVVDREIIKHVRAGLEDTRSRWGSHTPDTAFPIPIREDAAEALGRIGPAAKEAEPKLRAMMNSGDSLDSRVAAAFALFQVLEGDEKALDFLTAVAAKPTRGKLGATTAAIRLLGEIGPKARSALPAITRACDYHLKESYGVDSMVRHEALAAIAAVAGSESVPTLRRALRSADSLDRESAIDALSSLGSAGSSALPELIQAAQDDRGVMSSHTRQAAIRAIGNFRSDAESAIPVLSRLAETDEEAWDSELLAEAAKQAIAKITQSPKPALSDAKQ